MKKYCRKFISLLLMISILLMLSASALAADFNKGYSLSGSSADKMVSVATAQLGRTRSQLGYSSDWCALFVSGVAKEIGEASAIPSQGGCRQLYQAVIKAGGKEVTNPQKGDLVFFVCTASACRVAPHNDSFSHVALMLDDTYCISGNYEKSIVAGGRVVRHKARDYKNEPHSVASGIVKMKYVRPNYNDSSSAEDNPNTSNQVEYFSCNVQISCISGKQVNLYNNPGDAKRVDYFSKGQTVQSTYAAKIGNTTWYQIKAQSGNTTKTYWLRYESDKMTINDLPPTPPTQSLKVTVNPSNLTLDLAKQKSQTVTAVISGDIPSGLKLGGTISNQDIIDFQWADSEVKGGKARAILTGKATGNSTVTFKLLNTSGQTVASGSVNITVIDTTPITMTASQSIVSLDLTKQTSQTVSLTINGNVQGQLVGTVGDSNVAQYSWGEYGGGNVVRVIITGKNAGGTIVRFTLRDQNTGEVLASAYVHVAVTSSTYTVSYNANGGTNAPSSQTKAHQQAVTISNSQPTREGYTFLGWSTSANGPVRYRPGAQYTDNQSITLYAVWQQNPTKASVSFYRIELDEETLNVGESTSIHVIAVYSDNSTKDVTASCSLSLSDPSVASINWGRITAVKAGTTEISIKSAPDGMALHATPTFTVVAYPQVEENPIVGIEIRSNPSTISVGESTSVEVYAVHEDGIEDVITSETSINIWLSGIVELNGSTVTGLAEGSVVVFAEWNGYSSSVEISVSPSNESSYEIKPSIDNSYSDWFDSAYWREETSHLVYSNDNT